jgi:dTDP-4-dehydrorhamnose reductase
LAKIYGKKIKIEKDAELILDRSLNGGRFARATGYEPPPWSELLLDMHDFYNKGHYV